jgi:peptidoglycan/xylan/chitin deacetylase (PgdA/CDA1 family)
MQKRHLGLIGLALWLLAGTLTACAAQPAASVGQLFVPADTSTAPPAVTATPAAVPIGYLPSRTPSRIPLPAKTATARPAATEEPVQLEPTAVPLPGSSAPPASDGVARSADVPILMYHYISAAPSAQDRIRYGLSVPPEMFDAQLQLLRNNGFTTITLRDLYEYLAVGKPLPDRPVILTFDDGYVDNYTNAFPILQKYGMIGTFFVLTGPADDGDPVYLTWDMIQEMSGAGMDIQLHSRDHLEMRNRSYDWLVFQIIGGRQSIEGHTGKPVIFIAYPSGKYDANVQRFLSSTDFWAAVTTVSGHRHVLEDALDWDRVRISGQLRLQDFARLLGVSVTGLRSTPQPTATLTATPQPDNRVDSAAPTLSPTGSPVPPPAATQPRAAPDDPPGIPTRTPMSSPLLTPTSEQSPLATPEPR